MTDIEFILAVDKAEEVRKKLIVAEEVERTFNVALNEARLKRIAAHREYADACFFAATGEEAPKEDRNRAHYNRKNREATVFCHITGKMTLVRASTDESIRSGDIIRQDIPYVTNASAKG